MTCEPVLDFEANNEMTTMITLITLVISDGNSDDSKQLLSKTPRHLNGRKDFSPEKKSNAQRVICICIISTLRRIHKFASRIFPQVEKKIEAFSRTKQDS